MIKKFFNLNNITDEEELLDAYTMIGWGAIVVVLTISYIIEVIKKSFGISYLIVFLLLTVLPYILCLYIFKYKKDYFLLRKWIFICYYLMYIYVLLTGHTHLVFTYIFPILTFLILYHDPKIIAEAGCLTFVCNIIYIIKQYFDGTISLINSRDYEIQIALIILCFSGCYLSSIVYERINTLKKENADKVKDLLVKQTVLEAEKKMTYYDYLTGLYNRKKYDEILEDLLTTNFKPFYLVVIDVNGLKKCNDTLGHLAGDELIVKLADCINLSFDSKDAYGFRLGGDEFGIISTNNQIDFEMNLSSLKENINSTHCSSGFKLSAAIGYVYVSELMEMKEVIRLADEHMYQDKEKFYIESMIDRRS